MSDEKLSIDDKFVIELCELIETGVDKEIDPYRIIGFLEIIKQSLINNLLEVKNECK